MRSLKIQKKKVEKGKKGEKDNKNRIWKSVVWTEVYCRYRQKLSDIHTNDSSLYILAYTHAHTDTRSRRCMEKPSRGKYKDSPHPIVYVRTLQFVWQLTRWTKSGQSESLTPAGRGEPVADKKQNSQTIQHIMTEKQEENLPLGILFSSLPLRTDKIQKSNTEKTNIIEVIYARITHEKVNNCNTAGRSI